MPKYKDIDDDLLQLMTRIYNSGYAAGHDDTVEGMYTDILPVDMELYHLDQVAEIIKESE
jgi:hypothetical protein